MIKDDIKSSYYGDLGIIDKRKRMAFDNAKSGVLPKVGTLIVVNEPKLYGNFWDDTAKKYCAYVESIVAGRVNLCVFQRQADRTDEFSHLPKEQLFEGNVVKRSFVLNTDFTSGYLKYVQVDRPLYPSRRICYGANAHQYDNHRLLIENEYVQRHIV